MSRKNEQKLERRIEQLKKQLDVYQKTYAPRRTAYHTVSPFSSGLKNQPSLELKFRTEPIVGYRAWTIEPYHTQSGVDEWRLGSVVVGQHDWKGYQRNEASCQHYWHDAPHPHCTCGIWAIKEEDDLPVVLHSYNRILKRWAWGEVYLWGRVVECEKGWRAQYAYPKRVYVNHLGYDCADYVNDLRRCYGVPVEAKELPDLPAGPDDHASPALGLVAPAGGYVITTPYYSINWGYTGTTGGSYSITPSSGTSKQSWVSFGNSAGGNP